MINIKSKSERPGRRCPECRRKDSRFRTKSKDYVCKSCGCIYEILSDAPE